MPRGPEASWRSPLWAPELRLPPYALSTKPPADVSRLHRHLASASHDARSPVLPSLFMPGFPKCATTSLYKCLLTTFTPARVGCGDNASGWTTGSCRHRFLLATLQSHTKGHFSERKETFFFGGATVFHYREDLMALHGPDPRRGRMAGEPALWAWEMLHREKEGHLRPKRATRAERRDDQRMRLDAARLICQDNDQPPHACTMTATSNICRQLRRAATREPLENATRRLDPHLRPLCSTEGVASRRLANATTIPGIGLRTCTHPGCTRVAQQLPASWSGKCMWQRELHDDLSLHDAYCINSIAPWAGPSEINATVVDFTPNYLCDPDALPRIHSTAEDPSLFRFIVMVRDPVMRAFSEWSMFTTWGWDPTKTFAAALDIKLRRLRKCNHTLYQNVPLLRTLPTAELAGYLRQCFGRGQAMSYVETSTYGVCLLHALRYFRREQFLFLRFEDVIRMRIDALLALVARFVGLDAPDAALLRAVVSRGECRLGSGGGGSGRSVRKAMSFSSSSVNAAELLAAGAPRLERFLAPYDALLAELAHPALRWEASDHFLQPLNASQKAARLKAQLEAKRLREAKKRAGAPGAGPRPPPATRLPDCALARTRKGQAHTGPKPDESRGA